MSRGLDFLFGVFIDNIILMLYVSLAVCVGGDDVEADSSSKQNINDGLNKDVPLLAIQTTCLLRCLFVSASFRYSGAT